MKMYRFKLLLILIFFTSLQSYSQFQNNLVKNLQTKDFITFKNFTDNLSKEDKNIKSYWEIFRDIAPEYKEGVVEIQITYPDKKDSAFATIDTFKVYLITSKTKIIFYYFGEKKYKNVNDEYYEKLDSYTNKEDFEQLKNKFKSIFENELKIDDLFDNNLVYGKNCGVAAMQPFGRTQIDEWIDNCNKNELINWLKSANAEKQVYAIDGLFQLKLKGINVSENELNIIKYIKTKEGKISVCSGCTHSSKEIKEVTQKFEF